MCPNKGVRTKVYDPILQHPLPNCNKYFKKLSLSVIPVCQYVIPTKVGIHLLFLSLPGLPGRGNLILSLFLNYSLLITVFKSKVCPPFDFKIFSQKSRIFKTFVEYIKRDYLSASY